MREGLIAPYGGALSPLLVDEKSAADLEQAAVRWPSWDLTPRQICDLELLLTGGFSPLRGFMGRGDYESVCARMRLENGLLWPIPITLDVPESVAGNLAPRATLALRDPEGVMLAALHVRDLWQPDRVSEAQAVYGTVDREHPGVAYLLDQTNPWYVGGSLDGIQLPVHYDFRPLRPTPYELRSEFARLGWRRIVAFQTRNPMHRAHQELTVRAGKEAEANLLIHPVVGLTRPGDLDHYTRVRCYQAILKRYPPQTVRLALLPMAMRMAGPREAVWHAIVRRNCGCTHLIVGRDHAGPGLGASGRAFYGPYDAQEMMRESQDEIGVQMIPFRNLVYLEDQDLYVPDDEIPKGSHALTLSGTELRRRLAEGREIPAWFTFPEVAEELQRSYPPRHRQGFTVFFTGLSGAGKSTVAAALRVKLLEMGGRPVTLLDDDIVRRYISSELGVSREHLDINIRRIGFVASEITKNAGIAICAPTAPSRSVRNEVRAMIQPLGGFLLVYFATPLKVCEKRDRKGFYAKAHSGPYEVPEDADLIFDTTELTPDEVAHAILLRLEREGYVGMNHGSR